LTQNKCASGRSSSMLVGSSTVSSQDRYSGLTFFFLGRTIMSNSNYWNSNNQWQNFPWWIGLLTKYFNARWSVNIVNGFTSKQCQNFCKANNIDKASLSVVEYILSTLFNFRLAYAFGWSLCHHVVVLEPTRHRHLKHRHGHETFLNSRGILVWGLWSISSLKFQMTPNNIDSI
jgi:hypothetical protein